MRKFPKRYLFLILCACAVASAMWMCVDLNEVYYLPTTFKEKEPSVKYILEWDDLKPYLYFGEGSGTFYNRRCRVKNCYVTSDRSLLALTEFDAVLFHGPFIVDKKIQTYFPKRRSSNQSYIFLSMESSHNYYVSDDRFNNLFNFTMTYKLDSDIDMGYMVIRNRDGQIIGPAVDVPWMSFDDMSPTSQEVKSKLTNKSKAAAWFVSNCHTLGKREDVVKMLEEELKKYNLTIDIYGKCGNKVCPRDPKSKCREAVRDDYYFYLAFENSISEDYVTEKLLTALQNYAVPVVYGGADYARFMPHGIYLDIRKLSIPELVHRMVEAVQNKSIYYNYFKWHNHYSYHRPEDSSETNPICQLCSFLNQVDVDKASVIENFYEWWRPQEVLALGKAVLSYLNT